MQNNKKKQKLAIFISIPALIAAALLCIYFFGSAQLRSAVFRIEASEYIIENETIPFNEQILTDEKMNFGDKNIVSIGSSGLAKKTYICRYEKGKQISCAFISREVETQPQDKITVYGTRVNNPSEAFDEQDGTELIVLQSPDGMYSYDDMLIDYPRTGDDFRQIFRCMFKNGFVTLNFAEEYAFENDEYASITSQRCECIVQGFNRAAEDYPEYSSFFNGYSIEYAPVTFENYSAATYRISLDARTDSIREKIIEVNDYCLGVVDDLKTKGKIKASSNERERALALCNYICDTFTYDMDYIGTTPYDAISSNKAVCEQYAAVYNLLCRMTGLNARCVYGESDEGRHAWTNIYVGDKKYNVDTTWCDHKHSTTYITGTKTYFNGELISDNTTQYTVSSYNSDYFWISDERLRAIDPKRKEVDQYE